MSGANEKQSGNAQRKPLRVDVDRTPQTASEGKPHALLSSMDSVNSIGDGIGPRTSSVKYQSSDDSLKTPLALNHIAFKTRGGSQGSRSDSSSSASPHDTSGPEHDIPWPKH